MECTMTWIWCQHSNEHDLFDLFAADVSHRHWTCTITYLDCFVLWIHQSFTLLLCFGIRDKMWQPALGFLARNPNCDILIGWSCWGICAGLKTLFTWVFLLEQCLLLIANYSVEVYLCESCCSSSCWSLGTALKSLLVWVLLYQLLLIARYSLEASAWVAIAAFVDQ